MPTRKKTAETQEPALQGEALWPPDRDNPAWQKPWLEAKAKAVGRGSYDRHGVSPVNPDGTPLASHDGEPGTVRGDPVGASMVGAVPISALTTELQTDPTGRGYAAHVATGNHDELARLINEFQGGITVEKPSITSQELIDSVVQTEYGGLSAANRQYFDMLAGSARIDTRTGRPARVGLLNIFAAGTTTRTNLTAVVQRNGSRAEQLWGYGTVVTVAEIGQALS